VIVLFGCIVMVSLIIGAFDASPFVTGWLIGSACVLLAAIAFFVFDRAADARRDRFGTYGEVETANLFESRRMRRAGWGVVHIVPFRGENVDHVVFGPAGVLAIESKWANTPWKEFEGGIDAYGKKPLSQAWRGARHIRYLLRDAGVETDVVPVVIQWGPGGLTHVDWSHRRFEDGVLVLRGRCADEWIDELESFVHSRLDHDQLTAVRLALETRVNAIGNASTVEQVR
jgi:Nuclease-related domain